MPTVEYKEVLMRKLKDPVLALEYLRASKADSKAAFQKALRNVVEANGGIILEKAVAIPLNAFQHLIAHEIESSHV